MKIWVHRYELAPRAPSTRAVRHGALLKVEWFGGQFGYSDVHPWPEFGEAPLEEHLKSVAAVDFSPLVENSLGFNYLDREFRWLKRSAFLGLILPRSHRLVENIINLEAQQLLEWHAEAFTHVKVKMGDSLKIETEALVQLVCSSPMLWRLDMNGKLSSAEFTPWWDALDHAVKARIDFVEDPVSDGELLTRGPWAMDWKPLLTAPVRVIKTPRDGTEELGRFQRVVFTHSLDHPLGQACSTWVAARYYAQKPTMKEVCGLADPGLYEPTDFHRKWPSPGPRMKPTEGTGFGFDELLASISWERVL